MNFLGIWIAVAAIAAAASLQVVAASDLKEVCEQLDVVLLKKLGMRPDGEKVLELAKQEIPKTGLPEQTQEAFFEAWDNIYHGKECSDKSWDHMAVLSSCTRGRMGYLSVLFEPLQAYVKKCFKPADLEQRMKSVYDSSGADFIDSKFLETCLKGKREAKRPICLLHDSFEAVSDAIQQDLVKEGKDPKEFFTEPTDMTRYLKEKLVQPCENLKRNFKPVFEKVICVGVHHESRLDGFLASLSKKGRELIMAFEYCEYASTYSWTELAFETLQEFVPQLDRNNELKEEIEEDFRV